MHRPPILSIQRPFLAAAPNPAVFGQSVTFTATVSASPMGAGTPTGMVTFYDNGVPIIGTGGTLTGVPGADTATFAIPTLTVRQPPDHGRL